jgi:hypothetical protein
MNREKETESEKMRHKWRGKMKDRVMGERTCSKGREEERMWHKDREGEREIKS